MTEEEMKALQEEKEKTIEMLKERGFDSVEALLADRDSVAEERDKVSESNQNAQKVIQRQGAELGQLRKGIKPSEPQGGPAGGDPPNEPNEPAEETLEEIEKTLTPEQKAEGDKVFESLSDEDKLEIASNPDKRKKFLKVLREEIKSVPKSLWDTKPDNSVEPDATEDSIRDLFKNHKEQSTFTPPGSNRGAVSATEASEKSGQAHPIKDGVLNAAKEMREK